MSERPQPVRVTVSPEPNGTEMAAILAAYNGLWPLPEAPKKRAAPTSTKWRHSGRWWLESDLKSGY